MTDREALVEQIRREITQAAEAVGTVTGCMGLEQQIASAVATCAPQLADELTGGDVALGRRAAHDVITAVWGPGVPSAEWWHTPLGVACRDVLGRSAPTLTREAGPLVTSALPKDR